MIYTADKGVRSRLKQQLVKAVSAILPIVALALIATTIFSYTTDRADGTQPTISPPKKSDVSSINVQGSGAPAENENRMNTPSLDSSQKEARFAESAPAAQEKLPAVDVLAPQTPLSSTSSSLSGSTGLQDDVASNDNPVQTTVSIPPLDVRIGDKQIISTSGSDITLN